MTRCISAVCRLWRQPNGELFCWNHGTVTFEYMIGDAIEGELEYRDVAKWSDEVYIQTMDKSPRELASMLGVHEDTIYRRRRNIRNKGLVTET